MTINLSVPVTHELKPKITVIGVGGAGGNAVNNMITAHLEGVEFVVANTDAQALAQSLTERRVQLGAMLTQGLGAGARPEVGRAAAEEGLDTLMDHIQGANMVFITAGMGGGTGTGGAPVIAQSARDQGVLTVGVVTKPFHFEGQQRMRIAEEGIDELQRCVDTLIVIPNQNLFRIANEKTTFGEAFKMADDVLYSGVRGVTDLMVMPGLINLDFADVRSVMMEMGKAMMGTGEAEGERRALDAAEAAINNPLLDDVSLKGARGVLVNITGGPDMTLYEVDESCNHIRDQVDSDASIIFGSTFDEQLAGRVRVSVVATGIEADVATVGDISEPVANIQRAQNIVLPMTAPADQAKTGVIDELPRAKPTAPKIVEAPTVPADDAAAAADSGRPVAAPAVARADAPAKRNPLRIEPVVEGRAGSMDGSFIPPRPIEPAKPAASVAKTETPATESPSAPVPTVQDHQELEPRSGQSGARLGLFERMTRGGLARTESRTDRRPEPVLEMVEGTTNSSQGKPETEADLIDIPAFLRRQSN